MGVKPILSVARQTALSPATGTVGDAAKQTDEDWHEQFIKLNVNHITDAKVRNERFVGRIDIIFVHGRGGNIYGEKFEIDGMVTNEYRTAKVSIF